MLKTAGWYVMLRALAPFIVPAIILALIWEYWRPILIYGGSVSVILFIGVWVTTHRDRKQTERYYAAERERLTKLGLPQKMRPLTTK